MLTCSLGSVILLGWGSFVYGQQTITPSLPQQVPQTLSSGQLKYFVALFDSVASPDTDQKIVASAESAAEKLHDMSASDGVSFRSSLTKYTSEMSRIRAAEKLLVNPEAASLAPLIQARDQLVNSLALSLLKQLSIATATKLVADADLHTALLARP